MWSFDLFGPDAVSVVPREVFSHYKEPAWKFAEEVLLV
jgi:hypothetical protein